MVVTDIAGSTGFDARVGDLSTRQVIDRFLTTSETLVGIHRGHIVKEIGDGAMMLFSDADGAFAFAVALQRSLIDEPIVAGDEPIKVRISLHTGDIRVSETSYGQDAFGIAVDMAARLNGVAEPGEIVLSATAVSALSEVHRRTLGPPEPVTLKGNRTVVVNRVDVARG